MPRRMRIMLCMITGFCRPDEFDIELLVEGFWPTKEVGFALVICTSSLQR